MADRDDTLLPLPGWGNVLEQLSLPLRAYQRQLVRTYEPALRLGEQFRQAYGGWLRYWERFVYWEQLVAFEGSSHIPDWMAGEGPSTSAAITLAEGRPAVTIPGPGLGQLPEAGRAARSSASRSVTNVRLPADSERVLADLARVLEVFSAQLEQVTSSLNRMLAELNSLGEVEAPDEEGTRRHEKQDEG